MCNEVINVIVRLLSVKPIVGPRSASASDFIAKGVWRLVQGECAGCIRQLAYRPKQITQEVISISAVHLSDLTLAIEIDIRPITQPLGQASSQIKGIAGQDPIDVYS